MQIQNNSSGTSGVSSEAPQHRWLAHGCRRDTREKGESISQLFPGVVMLHQQPEKRRAQQVSGGNQLFVKTGEFCGDLIKFSWKPGRVGAALGTDSPGSKSLWSQGRKSGPSGERDWVFFRVRTHLKSRSSKPEGTAAFRHICLQSSSL